MSLTMSLSRVCGLCRQQITKFGVRGKSDTLLRLKPQVLPPPARAYTVSEDPSLNVNLTDYPADVQVSYDEFRFVEQILPKKIVPEIPHHSSYPTPSGWVPPNDELRSQETYLVRRTKNHVLPVYAAKTEAWKQIKHHVIIKNIEGDIWKLESDLRKHLQEVTQKNKINTQVHEVSRIIRIRGELRAEIATFLMDKGM